MDGKYVFSKCCTFFVALSILDGLRWYSTLPMLHELQCDELIKLTELIQLD